MLVEPGLEPRPTGGTVAAGVGAGFGGVEEQAAMAGDVFAALDETVFVGEFGEDLEEGRAAVVIADAEARLHRKALEPVAQAAVVVAVTPVGEVAGDHQQVGIGMIGEDVRQRLFEIGIGIAAGDGRSGGGQVDVGEVDELEGHRSGLWEEVGRARRRPGDASTRRPVGSAHFFGRSFCTSAAMSVTTASVSAARLPLTTEFMWSLITSVIFRPFSPGKAYHLVSNGSCDTAV